MKIPLQQSNSNVLRSGAILSIIVMGILLILSVLNYRERMLFIDGPHNLFLLINDGHFHIEERRYGSFISQVLPILCYRMHLPFAWVMISYSVSFNLFFLMVELLLVFKFREYCLAILFGLYLTLFASAAFYWPNNEVHQGTAWLMLVFAMNFFVARRKTTAFIEIPFFIISFYLALWTHPLIIIEAVFLWFFLWFGNIDWPFSRKQSVVYTILLFFLAFYKLYLSVHQGYDSSKMEIVTGFRIQAIKEIFKSGQMHFFIRNCLTSYWIFTLLFVSGISSLIINRKYLLAALTLTAAAGYLLLVCITFRDGNSNVFYIESEYMPMAVICCASFVYFVLPSLKKIAGLVLLLSIFSIRTGYIIYASTAFSGRVVVLENINQKMKEKNLTKAIITNLPDNVDSRLIMTWGGPIESIFLSKLKGENPQRTFIFMNPDEIKTFNTVSRDTLLGCWEKRPASRLNTFYFQLDTTSAYKVISYSALME